MSETSTFTPEGSVPFPHLEADLQHSKFLAEWDVEAVEGLLHKYMEFLNTKPMPRAKATAERIIDRCMLELGYREGIYEQTN